MSDLTILALNLHAGAGNKGQVKAFRFVRLMRKHDAQIGVPTEAKTAVQPMRGLDVRVLGENPKPRRGHSLPEQGDTILVVDGIKTRRWKIIVAAFRWMVRRYRQWHDPRRDPATNVRGPVKAVRGSHLPPGGPDDAVNGKAWRDQMDDTLEWLFRRGCRAAAGDFNASAAVILAYAKSKGYEGLQVDGVGVDLCLVAHGKVKSTNLGRPGDDYDHPAVLHRVTADRDELRRLRRIWRNKK